MTGAPAAWAAAITDPQLRAGVRAQCPACDLFQLRERAGKAPFELFIQGVPVPVPAPGFKRIDDPLIPRDVRAAEPSVFRITFLPKFTGAMETTTTQRLANIVRRMALTNEVQTVVDVLRAHVERCERDGREECEYPPIEALTSAVVASAFLVGDSGRELWTAAHCVRDAIKAQLRAQRLRLKHWLADPRQRLSFYMFDSRGEVLLMPSASGARVLRVGQSTQSSRDFAVLELDQALPRPGLKVARRALKTGEAVFSLGYPGRTGGEDAYKNANEARRSGTRYPFDDAPGNELRVTFGYVVDSKLRGILMDAGAGSSGGPGLTADGRVVGVNSRVGYRVFGRIKDPATLNVLRGLYLAKPTFTRERQQTSESNR